MVTHYIHSKEYSIFLKNIVMFQKNISMFEIKHHNEKNNLLAYLFFLYCIITLCVGKERLKKNSKYFALLIICSTFVVVGSKHVE